jgi:hypothetical protein
LKASDEWTSRTVSWKVADTNSMTIKQTDRISVELIQASPEVNETYQVTKGHPKLGYNVENIQNAGSPKGCESYGDGATIVVRGRESLPQGEGWQVNRS